MSQVTPRDIEALVEIFDRSGWDVLKLEIQGFKIHLAKNGFDAGHGLANGLRPLTPHEPAVQASPQPASSPVAQSVSTSAAQPESDHVQPVRAPNLGTFYRSPKPGTPPYVEIGQTVEADTEVCLIEVMKLFTTVRAGMRGIVRQVCVADSELVEGDQILFLIEPLS